MEWIIAGAIIFIAVLIVVTVIETKRRAADRAAQLALSRPVAPADDETQDRDAPQELLAPTMQDIELGKLGDLALTITDLTHWHTIDGTKIIGRVFPDHSVAATALAGIDRGTGKPTSIRFNRDTKIEMTGTNKAFDRCAVGLLRLAGITAPVRLPCTLHFGPQASRPAKMISVEAIVTYIEAGHASTRTTRRISVLGFESIGLNRKTDEVRLHAWCWQSEDYRTFNLSRVQSLMDPMTQEQRAPISWAWEAGAIKFPPSEKLTGIAPKVPRKPTPKPREPKPPVYRDPDAPKRRRKEDTGWDGY